MCDCETWHVSQYTSSKYSLLPMMIRYIKNIDLSISIPVSIYRIVSSRKYRIFSIHRDIFYISRYFRYIAIFYTRSLYFYYCITNI